MLGLEQDATESQETKEKVSFGSLFLDQVLPKIESKEVHFGLSATGHVDDYSGQFLWTLRIYRRPDERSYVVRDVVAFCKPSENSPILRLEKVITSRFPTHHLTLKVVP